MLTAIPLMTSRMALNSHTLLLVVITTCALLNLNIGLTSADTTAPAITLTADHAILSIEGEQVFRGNVVLSQGTITLNADEILIRRRNGAISYIGARGSPLLFENASTESGTTHIAAQKLEYETASWQIVLSDSIRMTKSGMSIHAERAEYHIRKAKYVLYGDSKEAVKMRIHTVLSNR